MARPGEDGATMGQRERFVRALRCQSMTQSTSLPFWPDEPARAAGGRSAAGQAPRRVSLVRLSGEIARSVAAIGRVAVEGEVHRPHTSPGGWTYFVLRDRAAQISVTCPARHSRRCRTVAGERVVAVGTLVWGNDRGQLVLEADEVTPVGEGAVAAMIAEARARLAADGLLGRPGRPLPRLPKVIGVLCGADAAVRKDIESVVAVRFPGYPLAVEETIVSGPGAALTIVEGLRRLVRRPGVEVVVLARGGGDSTALLPWSDEELCRAVAACPVPVVSAIGHESDHPLCDDVADLRCGTPSLAAHAVVPDQRQLQDELANLRAVAADRAWRRAEGGRERLRRADVTGSLATGLERAGSRLGHAAERLRWGHPGPAARAGRRRLDSCDWHRPTVARLAFAEQRLDGLARHARSLSPQHVIERGFAVVRRLDGTVVRDPVQVQEGELVELSVARGLIAARVEPPATLAIPGDGGPGAGGDGGRASESDRQP
jgi:exodeoxyribonuclease VII large subunit